MYRVKPLGGGHSQTKGPRMRQHRLCKKLKEICQVYSEGKKYILANASPRKGWHIKATP